MSANLTIQSATSPISSLTLSTALSVSVATPPTASPNPPSPPAPAPPPEPPEPLEPEPLPPDGCDFSGVKFNSSTPAKYFFNSLALSAPSANESATSPAPPLALSNPLPNESEIPPTASPIAPPTEPPPLAEPPPTLIPNSPKIELITLAILLNALVTALTIEFNTGNTTCNRPAKHEPIAVPNAKKFLCSICNCPPNV